MTTAISKVGRPAKKRVHRSADSADRLLVATGEALIARGSTEISLSEVAEHSGFNAALIKYYFGNKEGLLLALVRRNVMQSVEQMQKLLALDLAPRDKLRLHITGVIATYARYPYLNRLLHYLVHSGSPAAAREVTEEMIKPVVEAQRAILEEGVRLGQFRAVDQMHFYYAVMGACDLMFRAHSLHDVFGIDEISPSLREDYTQIVIDMALRLLSPLCAPA